MLHHEFDAMEIDKLNQILSGELSAVETYRQAIDRVKDLVVKEQLEELELSHRQRVQILSTFISDQGAEPVHDSWAMWEDFTRLLEDGPPADRAAVAALEEGEDRGLRDYMAAMEQLDPKSRAFVEESLLPAQERSHDSVLLLKETLH